MIEIDSSPFEWTRENTLIPRVDAIAVYVNPDGDAVIRQQDPVDDDDSVVIVPMEYVDILIEKLKDAKKGGI